MFANGNYSSFDPVKEMWTLTNNKGMRRIRRETDGVTFDTDSLPTAVETCTET
jgi:exoribonuclease R